MDRGYVDGINMAHVRCMDCSELVFSFFVAEQAVTETLSGESSGSIRQKHVRRLRHANQQRLNRCSIAPSKDPNSPFLQDGIFTEHFMNYKHAIVKVEEGVGTLLCNNCGIVIAEIVIAEGAQHEDREHYCTMCMSGNCKAKFKQGK